MTLPRVPGPLASGGHVPPSLRVVALRVRHVLRLPWTAWRTSRRVAARHAAREDALFAAHVDQALQIVGASRRPTGPGVASMQVVPAVPARPRVLVRP